MSRFSWYSDTNESMTEGAANTIKNILKDTTGTDAEKIIDEFKNKTKDPDNKGTDNENKRTKDLNHRIDQRKDVIDEEIKKTTDVVDKIDSFFKGQRVDGRTIIGRTKNSVLQFPVYISQSMRVNEATIIAGLFDRTYASYVQSMLSMNPIISADEVNDMKFLKGFHSNLRESAELEVSDIYETNDEVSKILKESAFYEEDVTPTCTVRFSRVPATLYPNLIAENTRLMNTPLYGLSYLNETTITDKETTDTAKGTILSQKDIEDIVMNELDFSSKEREALKSEGDSDEKKAAKDKLDKGIDEWRKEVKQNKDNKYKPNEGKYWYKQGQYYRKDVNKSIKTKTTTKPNINNDRIKGPDAPMLMKDTDIKKINALLPYTINASFIIKDNNGNLARDVHFIIGVKAVMHLIRVQDLKDELRELVTGKIKNLQKVRYKTGEITFWDYIFNRKQIRADAAKNLNSNKRWINNLKRLSEFRTTNASFLKAPISKLTNGSVPIPNATLILTQTDVTLLSNETGIDLTNTSNAKRLARSLFLIAFAIVDPSAGSMRVLFPDQSDAWDVQSLASIDAELAKTDNSQIMKELNKMVNR